MTSAIMQQPTRTQPNELLLRATSLRKAYPTRRGNLEVLREVTLDVAADESVAILGPSGSGKSTLLNILGAMEPPTAGSVLLRGVDPFGLSEPELARFRNERIGFVFQNHYLLPQCSAMENVLIPTLPRQAAATSAERATRLLDRVGLAARFDHRPAELSGGESQRVAVARALINSPALLLADEPTGNLDHKSAEAVVTLLLEIHHEERVGLVMVTHSRELAQRFDRRCHLVDGVLAAG